MRHASKISFAEKASCIGKSQYKYELAAEYAIDNFFFQDRNSKSLNVYKCRFCSFFHVGHTPKKAIKKEKNKIIVAKNATIAI